MAEPKPCVVHEQECAIEGWDDPVRGRVQWRTLLSGDRTPTGALTLGVAELDPARTEPLRLHHHAQVEVYYVLAGEGVVAIDDREYAVRPGSAVFIPGGAHHGVRNTGAVPLRLLYAFAADSFDQVEYVFPD